MNKRVESIPTEAMEALIGRLRENRHFVRSDAIKDLALHYGVLLPHPIRVTTSRSLPSSG